MTDELKQLAHDRVEREFEEYKGRVYHVQDVRWARTDWCRHRAVIPANEIRFLACPPHSIMPDLYQNTLHETEIEKLLVSFGAEVQRQTAEGAASWLVARGEYLLAAKLREEMLSPAQEVRNER